MRSLPGPPGAPDRAPPARLDRERGLNWLTAFGPLTQRYRVIAPDMRGHARASGAGGGFGWLTAPTTWPPCSSSSTPDPAIVVGYSMGGPIAQLLWRRHAASVAGLVLCATADRFVTGARERFLFSVDDGDRGQHHTRRRAPASRVAAGLRCGGGPRPCAAARPTSLRTWAAAEMRRHDAVKIMEAGQAIGSYNARRWIGEIDVPTTVMVTERDRAIASRRAAQAGGRHPRRPGPAASTTATWPAPSASSVRPSSGPSTPSATDPRALVAAAPR